jgi:FKBP-type peptidyl-prolyl cis-trans isomerase
MRLGLIAVLLVGGIYYSCSSDNNETILEQISSIESFVEARSESFESISPELFVSVIDSGDMEAPVFASTTIIEYVITDLNEQVLDAPEIPITIPFNRLIDGLATGLRQTGRGGRVLIVMSSDEAFGEIGDTRIPPNTPIFADATLVEHWQDITDLHERQIQIFLQENLLPDPMLANNSFYVFGDTLTTAAPIDSSLEIQDTSAVVTLNYLGYLLDGTIFDDRYVTQDTTVRLSQTIQGWQDVLVNFSQGWSGSMFLLPASAFGSEGYRSVPADTPVAFDFTIVGVD